MRELLTQCEQALEDGFPRDSLIGAIKAFNEITSEIGKDTPSPVRPPSFNSQPFLATGRSSDQRWLTDSRKLSAWITDTTQSLHQLYIGSTLSSLGLPMAETQKFRRFVKEIIVRQNYVGDWDIVDHSRLTDEEFKVCANFALGYLSTLALRTQEVYPEALTRVSFKMLLNDWRQARDSRP